MENQHRRIKGYRELNEAEIATMNEIKAKGEELGALIDSIGNRPAVAVDLRWLALGKTHLQQGLMALTRSVAQPSTF